MLKSFIRIHARGTATLICCAVLLTSARPCVQTASADDQQAEKQSAVEPGSDGPTSTKLLQQYSAAIAMSQSIDQAIESKISERGLSVAPDATDAEFIRRVYLDIAGTNPDPTIIVEFMEDTSADKRQRLVLEVVESPAVASRLADAWTDLLVPDDATGVVGAPARESLRRWLYRRFQENQRYDRIAGDLLIAAGNDQESPTVFFTSLELKPEKIAEKTSRVFLGIALDCAQCHDHPFDTWKQTDFWSLAAYFAQLRAAGDMDAPNPAMMQAGVYDSNQGEVTLPDKDIVVPPKPLIPGVESSLGTGSRRQQLAIWLTSKENVMFSRAATNRIWSMLMGRGLVEPVDEMGSQSQASHPDLLDDLAKFFRGSDFDLRQLMVAIASTKAYGRSTNIALTDDDQHLYAGMIAKPLTAGQIASCLRQVARVPPPAGNQPDAWKILAMELGSVRGAASEFTGGVIQSLRTQHDSKMEALWDESSSKLLKALNAPFFDESSRVRWMYLATLGRPPMPEELQVLSSFLNEPRKKDETPEWQRDLLWALLNSTEFAMTP